MVVFVVADVSPLCTGTTGLADRADGKFGTYVDDDELDATEL